MGVDASTRRRLAHLAELTGLPIACVDPATGAILDRTDTDALFVIPGEVIEALPHLDMPRTFEFESGWLLFAVVLFDRSGRRLVAVGNGLTDPTARPPEWVMAAVEANWSKDRLDRFCAKARVVQSFLLSMLLSTDEAVDDLAPAVSAAEPEATKPKRATADLLENAREELDLLHGLVGNLQISRAPADLAEICLNRMHTLIRAEGSAIWLKETAVDKEATRQFLVAGNLPFDEFGMARLTARVESDSWCGPCVKNNIKGTLLGVDFPELRNLIIMPIGDSGSRAGWIVSCNLENDRDFDSLESSLIKSVAMILGTHIRNIELYQQNNQLLLSFVRSLVSTLDAKDPYTRGHSERVALVARKIGEQLNLPEDDLYDIYLAGLMHDIGKVGIDDRILRKPGALTYSEFKEIQKHPLIGFAIMRGLKNLRKILPGIRNHHENYNGKGYPDGLEGEAIPLMARILAVADSFDAMSSDRPYRKGLELEKIEEIFRRGTGVQWDARIVEAFFAIRDDIAEICMHYRPDSGIFILEEITSPD